MQKFSADSYFAVGRIMGIIASDFSKKESEQKQLTVEDAPVYEKFLNNVKKQCSGIQLRLSEKYIDQKLLPIMTPGTTYGDLAKEISILQERMKDEMEEH